MPAKTKTTLTAREKVSAPEVQDAPVYVMCVEENGKTFKLRNDELGPADRTVMRQETGLSLNEVLSRFDTDSPLYILWLARRKSGEPNLRFAQVIKNYKNDRDLERLNFRIEDLDGNEVDVDDDPLADAP